MDNRLLAARVAARYLSATAVVLPFKPKQGVPTLAINGKKYVLSTDGGPLGDREDDELIDNPRIIRTPQSTKWKYLWAYDTEKQYLAMWRVSDGNEKLYNQARSEQARIIKLDKKSQLNRVTHEEMRRIENEMRDRQQDAASWMADYVEENKDESTKRMDRLVQTFFTRFVEPKLNYEIDHIERGAIPIGFKLYGPDQKNPATRKRQMVTHVITQTFLREMTLDKVTDFLRKNGVDVETEGQWINWAIDDVREKAMEVLLPSHD